VIINPTPSTGAGIEVWLSHVRFALATAHVWLTVMFVGITYRTRYMSLDTMLVIFLSSISSVRSR